MMEEIGDHDDTNGESTFEIIGGRGDEGLQVETNKLPPTSTTVESSSSLLGPTSTEAKNVLPPAVTDSSQYFAPIQPAESSANTQNATKVYSSPLPPPQPIPLYSMTPGQVEPPVPSLPITSASQQPPPIVSPLTQYNMPTSPFVPVSSPSQPQNYSQPYVPPPTATVNLPFHDDPQYVSQSSLSSSAGQSGGMWDWIKGNEMLNRFAEKAKNSVDSMITTLDPGMKEFIYSGGDIDIVVASDKEIKISPIREAFQNSFGRATITGIASQSISIANQPVGFSSGLKAAEERISYLRQQGLVDMQQPVVAIENFLAELTPDRWYDMGCLVLQDPGIGITMHVYTQATPVAPQFITQLQNQTPKEYPLAWSGYAITIGQIVGTALGVPNNMWQEALTGVSRREMLSLAARTLAGIYKNHLNR